MGYGWGYGWGLAGAGRGMAGHGWDRRGLAGGLGLGGARVRLGGSEFGKGRPRVPTLRSPFSNPVFLLLSWDEDGTGGLPLQPGIKGPGASADSDRWLWGQAWPWTKPAD